MGLLSMILRNQRGRQAEPAAASQPSLAPAKEYEYPHFQTMIAALLAEGPPMLVSAVLIDRYKTDWMRKQGFSNDTMWFVYCNQGGLVECVWWIAGNSVHASVQGMKCYDMRSHVVEAWQAEAAPPAVVPDR